eukprot:CAMPEP_0169433308 /NCGR_PEP_ID=MMETSP1042-20121227/3942_1 /TAXON_ID=464988 /ORGANISM="Hemiselmis andersenii, Strain CCMP1180" /LENGTH=101 /DNA_ID=CAMNT_0009543839 /DNA_START=32 /DNA_END=338 /DNA_ORIENTATION=+
MCREARRVALHMKLAEDPATSLSGGGEVTLVRPGDIAIAAPGAWPSGLACALLDPPPPMLFLLGVVESDRVGQSPLLLRRASLWYCGAPPSPPPGSPCIRQ